MFKIVHVIITMVKFMRKTSELLPGSNSQISLKQSYIKAMENSLFRSLVLNKGIKEDLAIKYTSRLMDCVDEINNCQNCNNLSCCKNSVKGYFLIPEVGNKSISFAYSKCRFSKQEQYKENMLLFDIPKAIKNASMKNIYTNDKNRLSIIKALKEFINNYKNDKKTKGIYLHGSFGSGKTYLIAALFNELAKSDVKSVIVHVPELLRSLKESFSNNYSEKFYLLKTVPILLLDDIGAEYLTNWGRDEVLEPILQYRMDEGLPTFFTSNFTLEELEKHLVITSNSIDKVKAKRIIERVKQLSDPIELISKNLRN